jgi:hypothetical protein
MLCGRIFSLIFFEKSSQNICIYQLFVVILQPQTFLVNKQQYRHMKKIFFLLSVLISCVLFSSCKNANAGAKGSHELDGYTYKTSNGLMTYSFNNGKCTWTMDDDYLGTTQTYPYKVVGSNLYIGLDYPEFDMPVEKYASITGTISPDMNTIYMTHKGAGITYTAYRTN